MGQTSSSVKRRNTNPCVQIYIKIFNKKIKGSIIVHQTETQDVDSPQIFPFFLHQLKNPGSYGTHRLDLWFESFWINLYKIQPVLSVRSVVSTNDVPLFWWCWDLLVRSCWIFYSDVWVYFLIKYIQRNKESKGTKNKEMLYGFFLFKHFSTFISAHISLHHRFIILERGGFSHFPKCEFVICT